ncbi:MAG TPA: GGDEF domain-containing protein [Candidatus Limnocylindrales bacterium]
MLAFEPLLGVTASVTLLLAAIATLVVAGLVGRGPLYRRIAAVDRPASASPQRGDIRTDVDVVPGNQTRRPAEEELDEVLRGSFTLTSYNRAVRIIAWSFITQALLVVALGALWRPVQPRDGAAIILAAILVLLVHELMPAANLRTAAMVVEGTAAIVFVTILVMMTGNWTSPFFFVFPVLIGGAALVAAPPITLILTIEAAAGYVIATVSTPMDPATSREAAARVAINLTILVLMAYAGAAVARVQRRTREAAIRLSTVDSMTGLRNRAYFFDALEHEVRRSQRFRRAFCLLMIDLDGLKVINDRYGHYGGDAVLREVAQVVRVGLRSVDTAGRYGGDEFVALLPETDPIGAYVVAEKIRQAVSDLIVQSGEDAIAPSVSIGVVSYPDDGGSADELMIAADRAMYASKRLGKNRVVGHAAPGDLSAPATHSQHAALRHADPSL